jgi:hypothetical protein
MHMCDTQPLFWINVCHQNSIVFENKEYANACTEVLDCLLMGDAVQLAHAQRRLLTHTRKKDAEVTEFLSAFEDNIACAFKPFFYLAREVLAEQHVVSIIYNILVVELVAFLNNYAQKNCVCIWANYYEKFVFYDVSKWVFRLAQAECSNNRTHQQTRNTIVTRFQVKTKRKRVASNDKQINFVFNYTMKLKRLQELGDIHNANPWIGKLVHVFVGQAKQRILDDIEDLACASVLRRVCKRSRDAYNIRDCVDDVTAVLNHVVVMVVQDACPDSTQLGKPDIQCTRCRFEATCLCEACEHAFCQWHFGELDDERCEMCVKQGARVCDPCVGMVCAPGTP